jgi:tRNA (guanine37-N1)-methyltransferase
MICHIITIFPQMMDVALSESILGRAREWNLVKTHVYDLRDFTDDRHRTVDDVPYGGGPGMVFKPEPLFRAVEHLFGLCSAGDRTPVYMTSPHGRVLDNGLAVELAAEPEKIIICGHYGGIDDRVRQRFQAREISIGDFVLTGGELPALVIIDAAARFVPGVVGNSESVAEDTFNDGLLGAPNYTRPAEYQGWKVPEVLPSGHHANITAWRRRKKLELTLRRRPDLLHKAGLSESDIAILKSLGYGKEKHDGTS